MEFNYNLYPGRKRKIIEFESNSREPKISIITAYYNGHKYIDETLILASIFSISFNFFILSSSVEPSFTIIHSQSGNV